MREGVWVKICDHNFQANACSERRCNEALVENVRRSKFRGKEKRDIQYCVSTDKELLDQERQWSGNSPFCPHRQKPCQDTMPEAYTTHKPSVVTADHLPTPGAGLLKPPGTCRRIDATLVIAELTIDGNWNSCSAETPWEHLQRNCTMESKPCLSPTAHICQTDTVENSLRRVPEDKELQGWEGRKRWLELGEALTASIERIHRVGSMQRTDRQLTRKTERAFSVYEKVPDVVESPLYGIRARRPGFSKTLEAREWCKNADKSAAMGEIRLGELRKIRGPRQCIGQKIIRLMGGPRGRGSTSCVGTPPSLKRRSQGSTRIALRALLSKAVAMIPSAGGLRVCLTSSPLANGMLAWEPSIRKEPTCGFKKGRKTVIYNGIRMAQDGEGRQHCANETSSSTTEGTDRERYG